MYSFLFVSPLPTSASALSDERTLLADLDALGCRLVGRSDIPQLVHQAAALAPEMVICSQPVIDESLLAACTALQAAAPLPVLVITEDSRSEMLLRALDAGVQGWSAGWHWTGEEAEPQRRVRLAAKLRMTQARFTREGASRAALADALARLDERKWVERAKGVLMAARQITEEDAFRLLRGASMHTNLRVGDVSRSVIEAAQRAEAVNRAGQLRMLSQRLVRLMAQCAAGVDLRRSREAMAEAEQRVRDNLEHLRTLPPQPAVVPALAEVTTAWTAFQAMLAAAPQPAGLRAADAQAEALLARAEALVAAIEGPGAPPAVHIVNVSGRQRMLVQRLAKDALLDALLNEPVARERVTGATREFDLALGELDRAPLTSPEIREVLDQARAEWLRMTQALRDARSKSGQQALARSADALLAHFERLTDLYERSLQVIMGG